VKSAILWRNKEGVFLPFILFVFASMKRIRTHYPQRPDISIRRRANQLRYLLLSGQPENLYPIESGRGTFKINNKLFPRHPPNSWFGFSRSRLIYPARIINNLGSCNGALFAFLLERGAASRGIRKIFFRGNNRWYDIRIPSQKQHWIPDFLFK